MRKANLVVFLSLFFFSVAKTVRADDHADTTKPAAQSPARTSFPGGDKLSSSVLVKKVASDTVKAGSPDTASLKFNDTTDYAGVYTWNDNVQIWRYDWDSNRVVGEPFICDMNAKFQILESTGDVNGTDTNLIIKYLYYLDDEPKVFGFKQKKPKISNDVYFYRYNFNGGPTAFDSLDATAIKTRQLGHYQLYFLVNKRVFKKHSVKVPPYQRKTIVKGGLGFGVLNYPFKFRIQPHMNDFSGSFNVGAAVAYTYRHDSSSKWCYSHVLGLGISSVTLDKASVNTDTAALSSTNSFSALTLSYGFMVQYDKVQVGFFIGWDRISNLNNSTYGWKYQGNPWISVGIGLSIFSTSSSTTTQSQGDTQSTK